jgi:hypothetical protein
MASLRMILSAVSLSITMLLWPPTSPAGPKSCAENMEEIYKRVSLDFIMGEGKAQKYINDTLPAFKGACPGPGEANSIQDLENGNYLKKLAAEREKRKKSHRHVKAAGQVSDAELMQDLSLQF